MSCKDLNRRANQLAHYLRQLGVKTGDLVVIFLDGDASIAVAHLAVLKAGCVCVPIDPTIVPERLASILADCEPQAILTVSRLRQIFSFSSSVRPVVNIDDGNAWQGAPATNLDPWSLGSTPDDLACVVYPPQDQETPRGLMISHRSLTDFRAALIRSRSSAAISRLDLRLPSAAWPTAAHQTRGSTYSTARVSPCRSASLASSISAGPPLPMAT